MINDEQIDIKEELHALLRYYDKRLDSCTVGEMKSLNRMLIEHMEIEGTLDDFSEFYGKSKDAVSSVIKRRMIAKPRRNIVLYPFHVFQRLIPDSWRKKL